MPHSDGSSLWRLSSFEQQRQHAVAAAASNAGLRRQTVIATTLQAELRVLDQRRGGADPIEVVAACLRLREPALIYLRYKDRVWPVTLFPHEMLYHSPRSLVDGTRQGLAGLTTLDIEPPGVRPPGHWMYERVAAADAYHPLLPALWTLALQGPRPTLLQEISGPAAYRVLRDPTRQDLDTPGALGATVDRLRKESAPLHKIARWPGMSEERASRLLNALYLTANLLVSRAHHAAAGPSVMQWLRSLRSH